MSWRDALTLAGREIRRRPGRAALTVLAVALASALLCALLTIAGTARTRVLSQLSHGGSLAGISVEPNAPNPSEATLDDPVPGPPNPLTPAAIAQIGRLKDVLTVLPIVAAPVELLPPAAPPAGSTLCPSSSSGSGTGSCGGGLDPPATEVMTPLLTTSAIGADLGRVNALPITLLAGRLPIAGSADEVAVDEQYLSSLGLSASRAPEVVGTRVVLATSVGTAGPASATRFQTAEIVGVLDQEMTSGDIVAWPTLIETLYSSETPAGESADPPIQGAVVIAKQLSEVSPVRAAIAGIGYSTAAPVGLIISVGRYLHVVELVLSGIGIVALAIAALGIANALFAAVRERRREIGVLKAIGARDRDVLRVFLIEAGLLGVLGGLVGTVIGIAMAAAIAANANAYLHSQGLGGVALSVPWPLPFGGVVGACAVALVAGALPARRAAHLPAREAVDA
ncbi:MAG TPA: ABC transporter permease [Acidimicrobiales bacterium]|nr:ABC transporter permease [Acidimicrobiales bacterium]